MLYFFSLSLFGRSINNIRVCLFWRERERGRGRERKGGERKGERERD